METKIDELLALMRRSMEAMDTETQMVTMRVVSTAMSVITSENNGLALLVVPDGEGENLRLEVYNLDTDDLGGALLSTLETVAQVAREESCASVH